MALAYTAPTWENGSGSGISASQLQALSDCMQGLVQGSDKAIHSISFNNGIATIIYADGSIENNVPANMKGISSIAKTGTAGLVDIYTITFTDGTTFTYTVTNGAPGQVQADWNENDSTELDYIKNKPTIPDVHQLYELDDSFITEFYSSNNDSIPVHHTKPGETGSRQMTVANLKSELLDNVYQTTNATSNSIDDANYIPFYDSDYGKQKITFQNLKAAIGGGGSGIDGSTATPTDVIATWLECAGLHQNYTTLNEVLADSGVLSALMASTNAVDYLVRSTTWASAICANELAMNYIGANNYCADILLANSTWRTAICGSTYFESVLNVKVPHMTSDTTPYGQTFGTNYSGDYVWKLFDGDSNTYCNAQASTTNQYFGYKFVSPVCVQKATLYGKFTSGHTATPRVEGSNDGTNWTSLGTFTISYGSKTTFTVNLSNSNSYSYYRVFIPEICHVSNQWGHGFYEIQFYGRSDLPISNDDATDVNANITAIATNEPNSTASKAYAIGEHFYKDGKFCTAKTAIASGATFTLGTNYVEGTVAESIHDHIFYDECTKLSGSSSSPKHISVDLTKYMFIGLVVTNANYPFNTSFSVAGDSVLLPVEMFKYKSTGLTATEDNIYNATANVKYISDSQIDLYIDSESSAARALVFLF